MRKPLAATAIVCGTIVLIGLLKGCASEQRPLPLNASEETQLEARALGLSLGVEPSTPPVYAENLLHALRQTGLFRDVQPAENIQTPDLFARVERPIYGNAVIPILTFVTLGLIPTVTEDEHGHSFSLRSPTSSAERVMVEYVHRGYTVLGWVAGFLNLFPQWTGDNVRHDPRFQDRLKLAILTKTREIHAVMAH